MRSRGSLRSPMESNDDEVVDPEEAEVKAVVKIQALARMLQQKRLYRRQIEAAVTIQVIYVHILQNRRAKRRRQLTLRFY